MGVIFDCVICGGQAGEFEIVNEEFVCGECQEKAMAWGIMIFKKDIELEGGIKK